MLTTGVDIIEIERIRKVVERWGQRFLHRIYTEDEISYCRGRPQNLAARFAAKEAAMKALGTGLRGVGWKDVEVIRNESGAPSIRLHGRALARSQRLGVTELALSLSHSRDYAVAFVVGSIPGPTASGQPGQLPSSAFDELRAGSESSPTRGEDPTEDEAGSTERPTTKR